MPKKAYSFGLAREAFKKVFLRHNPAIDVTIPGPGTYNPRLAKTSHAFSLRAKPATLSLIKRCNRG